MRDTRTWSDSGDERSDVLRRRARRLARQRDFRKASIALRELVAHKQDAASWVALGDMLVRARRNAEALQALRQGLWLHRRAGAAGRARTVARMIVALDPTDEKAARFADLPCAA